MILPWHFAQLNEGFPIQCYLSHAFYSSKEFREALRSPSQINSSKAITKFPAVQFSSSSITEARWVEVEACPDLHSKPTVKYFFGWFCPFSAKAETRGGREHCQLVVPEV